MRSEQRIDMQHRTGVDNRDSPFIVQPSRIEDAFIVDLSALYRRPSAGHMPSSRQRPIMVGAAFVSCLP